MSWDPVVSPVALVAVAVVALVAGVWRHRRGAPRANVVRSTVLVWLAVVVAANPLVGGRRVPALLADADVLFVVDTTGSIAAEDYAGSRPRLDGVRADIVELAGQLPGARVAMISVAAGATLELPWTTDRGALSAAVDVLDRERTALSAGSSLEVAVPLIAETLQRGSVDGRRPALVLLTDGEQTSGQAPASLASIASLVDRGAVLGYGTEAGGRMRENLGRFGDLYAAPYIHDPATGSAAVSRIDQANLRRLAGELGVGYLHRTSPGGLTTLATSLSRGTVETAKVTFVDRRPLYWIVALGLVAVAAAQLFAALHAARAISRMVRP